MIRVLVIDDSAVMRSFLARIVGAQDDMVLAGVVSDPLNAISRIRQSAPDVITLDVEMPGMNGLDFLGKLMAMRPIPVVMISSVTQHGAEATMRALELGAVDFFPKPAALEDMDAAAADIADKIRAAAVARVARRRIVPGAPPSEPVSTGAARPTGKGAVIGIGGSTGAVEALRVVLADLPESMPPILVAQHILPGFTGAFARRLDSLCRLTVKEAQDGEEPLPGHVYIAPGGWHLRLASRGGRYVLRVSDDPPVNRHRPCVDVMFQSMAEVAGARAIAVLLTGMGADGAQAMVRLRARGAHTIAQDEASCVVFGMPRQAIALGGAQEVLALDEMARRLIALSNPERARTVS